MPLDINRDVFNNPELSVRFNTLIGLTFSGVGTVYNFLNNKTIMDDLNFLFIEPSEYINSIRAYPFDVRNFFRQIDNDEILSPNIPVANVENSGINGVYLRKQSGAVKVANFLINTIFDDAFLDYSPYTEISLFLPFYGYITLPNDEVVGKYVSVYYAIDFYTGMCTIFVNSGAREEVITHRNILNVECKIGVDIPIGSNNYNEQTKNLLTAGIGIVGGAIGIASGNAPAVFSASQMLLNTSVNAINNSQIHVTKGTMGDGRNAIVSGTNVRLIRKFPVIISIDNYNEFKGRPLGVKKQLNELLGYTQCEEVHFIPYSAPNNATPTSAEIDDIESLLRSGVIIHG